MVERLIYHRKHIEQNTTNKNKEEDREKMITNLGVRDYDQVNRSGVDLETYLYQRELQIIRGCK